MSAIKPNSLSKFTGMLSIAPTATPTSFQRLGSVTGLAGNIEISDTTEIRAQDTGLVAAFTDLQGSIAGTFLEVFDLELIKTLFGGTKTDTAASSQSVTDESVTGWTVGTSFALTNKNADGTIVTSIDVKADGSSLVLDTDYKTLIDGDGYTKILPLTSQTGAITVDYSYTPNANEELEITLGNYEVPSFVVKIETVPDSTGKTRTITLNSAKFEGTYALNFSDVSEAKEIEGAEFTFTGEKGSTVTIYDEKL